jgi:hypothetical protein
VFPFGFLPLLFRNNSGSSDEFVQELGSGNGEGVGRTERRRAKAKIWWGRDQDEGGIHSTETAIRDFGIAILRKRGFSGRRRVDNPRILTCGHFTKYRGKLGERGGTKKGMVLGYTRGNRLNTLPLVLSTKSRKEITFRVY